MPSPPIVSVVIPVKGRSTFVHAAVRSVQAQCLEAFELLLCDDDSDPETRAVIREACAGDPRIRIVDRGNRPSGGGARRNDGAAAAVGRYLVFFDSDDLMRPECLRDRVAWLQARPEVGFCVSECRVFERVPGDTPYTFNVTSAEDDLERFMRHDFPWQTAAPTWRRDAFAATRGWDESLPSWQDWDLHIRALLLGRAGSAQRLRYARTGTCDYDYRRTRGVAVEGTFGTRHLHTRRGLLAKIAGLLSGAQMTDSRVWRLLGGLYFHVAWRLACEGFVDEAVVVWGDARRLGVAPGKIGREGRVMLRLAGRPALRGVLQRYRFASWPVDLHHTPSRTLMRAWALPQ